MGNCGSSDESAPVKEQPQSATSNEPVSSSSVSKTNDEPVKKQLVVTTTDESSSKTEKKDEAVEQKQQQGETTVVTKSSASTVNPDEFTNVDLETAERIFKGVQAVSSAEYYTWKANEAISGNQESIANAATKLAGLAYEDDWKATKVGVLVADLLQGASRHTPPPFGAVVSAVSHIVRIVVAISANKYLAKQLSDRLVSLHPAIFILIRNKYPDAEALCARLLSVIGRCQEILEPFSDLGEDATFFEKLKQKWGQFTKAPQEFEECHSKIDQVLRDITFSTVQQELVGPRANRPSKEEIEDIFRKEAAQIISSITSHIDLKLEEKDSKDEERTIAVLENISDLTKRVNILLEKAGETDVDCLTSLTESIEGEISSTLVVRTPGKPPLGSGLRATVYEGTLKRVVTVAMKDYSTTTITTDSNNNKSKNNNTATNFALTQARAEYDILKKLQNVSPDVIRVYGIRKETNELIMEKLDYSLEDYLPGGKQHQLGVVMSIEQKLSITMCLVRALRSLHACSPKIVHGDLKSSNLLVSESGFAVKLIDFGSAATRTTTMSSAKAILAAGENDDDENEHDESLLEFSLAYAAPEVLTQGIRTEATDIYGFAITCFELWEEKQAYHEKTNIEARVTKQGLRPSFDETSGKTPTLIRRLIEWCWQTDPKVRPDAFKLNELRALWAGEVCRSSTTKFFSLRSALWPSWLQVEAPPTSAALGNNDMLDNGKNLPPWMSDLDEDVVSPTHKRTLSDQQISSLELFVGLTDDDLKEIFKELGARKIIRAEINRLQKKVGRQPQIKIDFNQVVAAIKSKNIETVTALLAPHFESEASIDHFMKQQETIFKPANEGRNILHWAVLTSFPELCQFFVSDHDARSSSLLKQMIGDFNDAGYTPLMIACQKSDEKCAEILIRNRLSTSQLTLKSREMKAKAGFTALHHCAYVGNCYILKLLVQVGGASPEIRTTAEFTPLHTATYVGNQKVAECLLFELGADVNSTTNKGSTCHFIATERDNVPMLEMIMSKTKMNLDYATPKVTGGFSLLHHAAFHGRAGVLDFLLKNQQVVAAQLEKQSAGGSTPLLLAIDQSHEKCVELLVKAGANKKAKTYQGKDAAALAKTDAIKKLVKTGIF